MDLLRVSKLQGRICMHVFHRLLEDYVNFYMLRVNESQEALSIPWFFFISFILKYSMLKHQLDTFYSCVSQRTLAEGLFNKPLVQSAKRGKSFRFELSTSAVCSVLHHWFKRKVAGLISQPISESTQAGKLIHLGHYESSWANGRA